MRKIRAHRNLHIALFTALFAAMALIPQSALASRLYGGSYSTDVSSSAPGALSPADGTSSAHPNTIKLAWNQVAGASKYQVQVARQQSSSADCNAVEAFQADNRIVNTTTTETQWVPTLTSAASGSEIWTGTYCWRVRSTGASRRGAWSSQYKFSRTWVSVPTNLLFYNDTDGPIPRTSSSVDYGVGSTTTRNTGYFRWDAISGAATYDIEVSTSQSFSEQAVLIERSGIRGTRAPLIHLPDDTYYWRVRAISSNGTEGGWTSGASSFQVLWRDNTWASQPNIYPVDSSDQSDLRVGWTPMPGATYYEYQLGSNGGCFWDPSSPESAPDAYGDWVNYGAKYDDLENLQYTAPRLPTQCRLSAKGATTLNNWVTLQDAFDQEVFDNIGTDCIDDEGKVQCAPADFPDDYADDYPVSYRGTWMSAGEEDGPAYSIHWRVRPVYTLNQGIEDGWKVSGDLKVYGSWSRYDNAGTSRPYRFDMNHYDGSGNPVVPTGAIGTRCDSGIMNPTGNQCLIHGDSLMQADSVGGPGDSATLQVPVLTWTPFIGLNGAPWTGGYLVQIARDPYFNNMAKIAYVPGIKATGYGFQQSYSMTTGLADNSEGTGYWWRAVPCQSLRPFPTAELTNCAPLYSDSSPGVPISEDPVNGYVDTAVAQTFRKDARIKTEIVTNFEGSTPLIRWAENGVASGDFAEFARGVNGAEHYEFQMARDPFMTQSARTIKTTMPRLVPFSPGTEAGSSNELEEGLWYYRVRAKDRDELSGGWSSVSSFVKRTSAPAPNVSGGGVGAGVLVNWDPVEGASNYTFQWSNDSSFASGINAATTLQTAYRIPSTSGGTYYWRVRANKGAVSGLWSSVTAAGPLVEIRAADQIKYGFSRNVLPAGRMVAIDGQVFEQGNTKNGVVVQLQKKTAGCGNSTGSYTQIAQSTTGGVLDDGMVRFKARVWMNSCFRLAWTSASKTVYSAPISIQARPVVSYRTNRRYVRRGQRFCNYISSSRRVTGRLRIQYFWNGRFRTARSVNVTRMRSTRQCIGINRSGNFRMRVVLDRMNAPGGWRQYRTTVKRGPLLGVRSAWRIG